MRIASDEFMTLLRIQKEKPVALTLPGTHRSIPGRRSAVLITLGNQGMLLYECGRPAEHIPAVGTDEIVDLTGAGDTVAAVFTTAMAARLPLIDAARLGNCAASVGVMKEGCATVRPEELAATVRSAGL